MRSSSSLLALLLVRGGVRLLSVAVALVGSLVLVGLLVLGLLVVWLFY